MKLNFRSFLIGAAAAATTASLHAQSAIVLGERPIARPEVSAFVRKQFAQMDSSRDGRVSPAEFEAYRARQGERRQRGLGYVGRRWFERTDANVDGNVSLAEAIARPLEMFDMADVDRDGTASIREQSLAQLFIGN